MRRVFVSIAVLSIVSTAGFAQRPRYTSPPAKSSAVIGGKKVSVDYFAPSMHGRKVMGGLVPFGEVWCTGANIATGFSTEADLQIGELRLPRGTYSIWTLPVEKQWTLIVNKESGQFHLNYNAALDFGRAKMNVKTLATPVETFRIDVRHDGGNRGTLALVWENTEASVPFTVVE